MIYLNKFDTAKGRMIAMCDEEIMGRVLKKGKMEIDLKLHGGFYKGDLVTEEDAKKQVDDSVYSANVIGERSVQLLIDAGLIKKEDVKKIQKVPFVYLFRVDK